MEVAKDMWWKLNRIWGGSSAGYIIEVAQDSRWKLFRICGGSDARYVVKVSLETWWKLLGYLAEIAYHIGRVAAY